MSRVKKTNKKNTLHLQAMGRDDDHYIIFKDWKLNGFGTVEEQEEDGRTETLLVQNYLQIV